MAGAPTVPGTRPVPRLHADHVYGRLAELARRRHRSKPAAKATSTATAASRIALLANLRASSLGERRPSDHELSTWDKVDRGVARILLQAGGARARGARVPKFVVTKSSRSESHLAR